MKWTEEQRQAIELRGENLLVAAAAGSGKTAVLVERIKKLILEEKVGIDEMLIVTFTNAAAAEMKEKIAAALNRALREGEDAGGFLRKQLNLLYKANVSTFHSFALEVIRRYFYVIDIDPDFKISDEAETVLLQGEAMDELFEEQFRSRDPRFLAFLRKFASGRGENGVKSMISGLHAEVRSIPDSFLWLKTATEELFSPPETFWEGKAAAMLGEVIRSGLKAAAEDFAQVEELIEAAGLPKLLQKAARDAGQFRDRDPDLLSPGELAEFLASLRWERFMLTKDEKEPYEEIREQAEALRERGKARVRRLQEAFGKMTPGEMASDVAKSAEDAAYLAFLTEEYHRLFQKKKEERNLIDFSDIEHYALEVLKDETVAGEYRNKFRHIFVDEYQDSNLLQDTLIGRICRENNVFLVGDVKQSIYKFRLAEPELFLARYARYRDAGGGVSRKLDLNRNFRSKESVIRSVNRIFEAVMAGYDETAALRKGSAYEGPLDYPTELHLIAESYDEALDADEEIAALKKAEIEAYHAAKIIKDMLGKPIFDEKKGAVRPVTRRDVVVLMRATRGTAEIFARIFREEDLPAHVDDSDGYFDTVEVEVMLNLLRIVDNRRQDIPLLSVLCSSIFGYRPDDLARIRIARPSGSFYEAFSAYGGGEEACGGISGEEEREETFTEEPDPALSDRCRRTLEQIAVWKELARALPLEELVWRLMMETGFYRYVGALPAGAQRQANLNLLADKALAFRQSQKKGLYRFIRYIEAVKARSVRTGQGSLIGENEEVVRIMTVHKSKGLEFPVVLVAGLGKRFNLRRENAFLEVHKDVGIGISYVNPERRYYRKTLIQNLIREKNRISGMEEEIRILYVALTRAMDRLILMGTVRELPAGSRARGGPEEALQAGSFMEMLLPLFPEGDSALFYHDRSEIIPTASLRNENRGAVEALIDRALKANEEEPEGGREEENATDRLISEAMGYRYPYEKAINQRAKVSVSQLTEEASRKQRAPEEKPFRMPQPAFSDPFVRPESGYGETKNGPAERAEREEEKQGALSAAAEGGTAARAAAAGRNLPKLTAAERGTALHKFLLWLDFREAGIQCGRSEAEGLRFLREALKEQEAESRLLPEEAAAVEPEKLVRFFRSELGRRAAGAKVLRKETPFSMIRETDGGEVIIQGVIDCFFEENGELVLLDYKSGSLPENAGEAEKEAAMDRYRTQLSLYAEAIGLAKGRPVEKAYLYLFGSGTLLSLQVPAGSKNPRSRGG